MNLPDDDRRQIAEEIHHAIKMLEFGIQNPKIAEWELDDYSYAYGKLAQAAQEALEGLEAAAMLCGPYEDDPDHDREDEREFARIHIQ